MPKYSALLTGYCSNASFLKELQLLAKDFRCLNPTAFFLCDPVLGDDGKLYVPEEFVQIYRDIIPFASCVTPNQTEAELLSGVTLRTVSDARAILGWFHERGVKITIITSCWLDRSLAENSSLPPPPSPNFIDILASLHDGHEQTVFHLCIPKAPQGFTGTGDLTSALLLGWLHILKEGSPHSSTTARILCLALENTVATLQTVIHNTMKKNSLELCLIQSRDALQSPSIHYRAVPFL
jgi:pyridoxine kinase